VVARQAAPYKVDHCPIDRVPPLNARRDFLDISPRYDIAGEMERWVIDTDVLVAARRSKTGASNALLRQVDEQAFVMLASVPLFLEYEAVLCRAEQLLASGMTRAKTLDFLNYLAGLITPVRFYYLWRPQLTDVADEMVLETAINGMADAIVTFNVRHFRVASRFGIDLIRPDEALRRL
jgi:putative PIN family toxin of toxin-antitoxin system